MEKRIGSILILIENKDYVEQLNEVISGYSQLVVGRIGLPLSIRKISLISLILEGFPDQINSLAGKLGKIPGIRVKSMVIKYSEEEAE